jgi:hypothetical protein
MNDFIGADWIVKDSEFLALNHALKRMELICFDHKFWKLENFVGPEKIVRTQSRL